MATQVAKQIVPLGSSDVVTAAVVSGSASTSCETPVRERVHVGNDFVDGVG